MLPRPFLKSSFPSGIFRRHSLKRFIPHIPPRLKSSQQYIRQTIRENIYTIPNVLTLSRIISCPVLAWAIVDGHFVLATSLLAYAGFTDLADGYLARHFRMKSVLGTILDPAADKALMTTLTVALSWRGLLPVPLAVVIIGRDVLLSLSAFYIRYTSLPEPKTWARYWDFGIPSVEVTASMISKINTALQLALMGITTISPLLSFDIAEWLIMFQWVVGTTTVWSGLSYLCSKNSFRVLNQHGRHRHRN
ncbi:hypothetical protein FISHEDRAFT_67198 [Fistulina hepatica ATCC 64428]|uniref:CDP-alcohol phosphatidyltransferase n=1 Tax=Fistulina hepatica ATCC 64428 TaxID=1128425 RepID=A0A0D7A1P1_9AGAR|nr:hypothetical protein FISHEDRAFT_67198 [Fistulina hepatica ATCC 64428]